ncbi:AraC-type DNA-binding protein [Solimonas aquatica]|uniref:AraC-type DNA-binding protein n=1 Tax=Solimonas aquatica TaxID=489703 RepID=A0A1H9G3L3_9GAMM|nr:AraC-type DNA-binding protein [Solimonas aquatica]
MGDQYFYSLEGPLDSLPVERQMRIANLNGFGELVRKSFGADPRLILEHHGIDPRTVRDPDAYIDCKALVDVLEYCSSAFNDSLFGLRLAQLQEPDVYGCVTALCRASSSVREALQNFVTYIPVVHSPVAVLELVEGKEVAELRWHPRTDVGTNSQANYQGTLLNLKLLRQVAGRDFRLNYVNLANDARQKDIHEIENRLGGQLHARATCNAIAFPASLLDQPVASANRLLFRLLGGYLERVKSTSRTTIVERVEDYVRGSLSSGNCTIERCAKKLGTSVRTLQANLSEHALRFSDIVERQRIDLARGYLEKNQMTLDEVALMLGYSEQSSFGRAFKRWTGHTPQRFRRNLDI